jgi:hypothetical protein
MADRQNLFPDEQLDEQPGARLGSQVSKDSFAGAQLPGDWQERAGVGAADSGNSGSVLEDSEDSDESDDENGSTRTESREASEAEEEEEEAGEEEESEQDEEDRAAELEASRNQDRQEAANQTATATGNKDEGSGEQGAKQALSGMLKASWENLLTSFLTSIAWVDIHVFLNFIGFKMFCKLGEEWVPEDIAKSDPEKAKQMGKDLNLPESMGCCAVNGCCGVIIMIAIVITAFLVWVATNVLDGVTSLFKGLFS